MWILLRLDVLVYLHFYTSKDGDLRELYDLSWTLCSTVYDLSAADDSWSLDVFDVVTGNTSKSWKTVDG